MKRLWGRLKTFNNRQGFSFVELIAVLIIIAVLASIGVPVYLEQVKNARAAEAQTTIAAIKTAAKMYRQKYGDRDCPDVDKLTDKKFLEIDEATDRKWDFEIDCSGGKVSRIIATSTEDMEAGAGLKVRYHADEGTFYGYGQDEE